MDSLLQITRQEALEEYYSKKLVDKEIKREIKENPTNYAKVIAGVDVLREWLSQEYYSSKMARLEQLKMLDLEPLVINIFTGVAHCMQETLFTTVSSQTAMRLGFDDKRDAILTAAELLAVLCETDAFDINKDGKYGSLKVVSRLILSDEVIKRMSQVRYMPPMVCEPLELDNNYSSGYLTHKDSLILGSGNHHDGNICLDVLNKMNQVPLKLDTTFLGMVEEDPTKEFTIERAQASALKQGKMITAGEAAIMMQQQKDNWMNFKVDSYELYLQLVKLGNRLHLTHKVDKRGRIYASGYHITTMGTSFKKAMLELADEEIVMGVPCTTTSP